jgi:hypothetical protein
MGVVDPCRLWMSAPVVVEAMADEIAARAVLRRLVEQWCRWCGPWVPVDDPTHRVVGVGRLVIWVGDRCHFGDCFAVVPVVRCGLVRI